MSQTGPESEPEFVEEFKKLRQIIHIPAAFQRFWDRILSPAERKRLGSVKKAFRRGPIEIWSNLRGHSAENAVLDLAMRLNFTDLTTADWIRRELGIAESAGQTSDRPSWNRKTRELVFRGLVARRVTAPHRAINMLRVLDSFEELAWPPRIDDPIPDGPNRRRLNRTVEVLNSGCQFIRFHSDGSGRGFSWSQL